MVNTKAKLKGSIDKGANYLYGLMNSDNGLYYHHEKSPCSGIWVTAEALEFLITSQNLSREGMELSKINSMVKFIVDAQNPDGSWNVLKDSSGNIQPSSISTGHCIYALKLALSKNYVCKDNAFNKIYQAIIQGEKWLLDNYRENNDGVFWKTGIKKAGESLIVNTEGLRIEFVFTTFYAMLGFVNPNKYLDNLKTECFDDWVKEEDEKNPKNVVIPKIVSFLCSQAIYFYNTYRERELDSNVFSQISSTISRICGGLKYLNHKIDSEVENGLKKILLSNLHDSYFTSALRVNGDTVQDNTSTYNNNTPFDIAVAMFDLDVEYSYIKPIINKFLEEQQEKGFWYLNFTPIPSEIKVWSTTEALMVLERAFNYKQNTHLKKKVFNSIKKFFKKRFTFTLIGVISALILMVILFSINYYPTFQLSFEDILKNILGYVTIPLACGILLDVIKKIKIGD